jgi:hypothetical protein
MYFKVMILPTELFSRLALTQGPYLEAMPTYYLGIPLLSTPHSPTNYIHKQLEMEVTTDASL